MTHAMAIATIVHLCEEKRPTFDNRAIVATIVGWLFWSLLLLGYGELGAEQHLWPPTISLWNLVYPIATVAAFIAVATWKMRRVTGRAAAEKLKRYGAMWQSLYGAAWLFALGLRTEALWIGLFALGGFGAMTLIKEVTGLTGRPLSYRV